MTDINSTENRKDSTPTVWEKVVRGIYRWLGEHWGLVVWYALVAVLVVFVAYRAGSSNYLAYGLIALTMIALLVSPDERRKRAIKWISNNWSTGLWYVLSVVLVSGLAIKFAPKGTISWYFFFSGMVALAVIALVTRPVGNQSEEEAPYPKDAVAVFRLGYLFVVLMVLWSVYFLLFYHTPYVLGSDGEFEGPEKYLHSTLAILPGCDYGKPGSERLESIAAELKELNEEVADLTGLKYRRAEMPRDAHCGEIPPQWVLSIGGSILKCHINGTCRSPEQAEDKPAAPPLDLTALREELRVFESELVNANADIQAARAEISKADLLRRADSEFIITSAYLQQIEQKSADAALLKFEIDKLKTEIKKAEAEEKEAIEGRKIENNIPGIPIVGGVVVPMYFIVMAMMGGLVNMVRKLPEYQARTRKDYDGNFELAIESGQSPRPPIDVAQVPEYVVFQMLQVLSAIAIAILAYSFARPDEIASSVVLAFAAGFSSEVVLMLIRSTVDRLLGLGPRGPRISRVREKIKENREEIRAEILGARNEMVIGTAKVQIGDKVKFKQDVNQIVAGTYGTVVGFGADDTMIVRVGSGADAVEVTKPAQQFFELVEESSAPLFTLQDDPVG